MEKTSNTPFCLFSHEQLSEASCLVFLSLGLVFLCAQSSDEDPGETLKRTIKAERRRRKQRVDLPVASMLQ